jgi:hypothetical protein
MVILDLLATLPVEVESIHIVMGRVYRLALLECNLGRWCRDIFFTLLVVVRGGGHVVASEDLVKITLLAVRKGKHCG